MGDKRAVKNPGRLNLTIKKGRRAAGKGLMEKCESPVLGRPIPRISLPSFAFSAFLAVK
jgi:hypothetical protein